MKIKLLVLSFLLANTLIAQSVEAALEDYINAIAKPKTVQEFEPAFHFSPVNQDTTSSCWSFATLSFIETEMNRLHNKHAKLAMMFPVYYGFVEKIKLYVSSKGESRFSPGDLFSGVFDVIKKYGIVPIKAYTGDARVCGTFNHSQLYEELFALTKKLKGEDFRDEKTAVAEAMEILNKHLGNPPAKFEFEGKEYTPESFRDEIVKLEWDNYMMVTSFNYAPFYEKVKLNVPDNWTGNSNYINLPLDEFVNFLTAAIDKGYSAAIDADISEPAYSINKEYCVVPSFDIEEKNIDQAAREFRFNNGSTTDDHLMHIVAHKKISGKDWFLVKDSWQTAFETDSPKGYMFMDDNYIKLKVLAYVVHKDVLKEIEIKLKAVE
ncbi:MAG: hypothetical protein AUK34_14645 [Ignavibacteria bacterium CG2_30_36_16]|nr:MAG: hypothetical protein AUK34_14645 [Ignavibacteria bacterium CG2_30_36_16]PJB01202.1 MAG: peptidase C1 [Ignavibacteria bacterium CG_4_9_14_3_um_filter_36_18]